MLPNIPENFKPRSFWNRPEGTTGMIVLAFLGVAGVLVLNKILPFIITLLQNTIHAALLFIGLAVLIYVVTDKRFRTLLGYIYKSIMRAITNIFITIDPIGILENYVRDLEKSLQEMAKQINRLKGEMGSLRKTIEINEQQRKSSLDLAMQAKKRENQQIFVLKARRAGRLQKSNLTLQNLHTKMEVLYRVLFKMYETSQFLLEDLKDEVDVKKRERAAILAGHSAFKAAMKIIKGDPDSKELFDRTMEYLADDYGRKVGEIENFIDMSRSFIESVDIQNGVYEEEALQMLESWEKQSQSLLLGDEKKLLIEYAENPKMVLDLNRQLPGKKEVKVKRGEKKNSRYDSLFESDS